MHFFSHPSNARRAARKALGENAKEGEAFKLIRGATGVAFQPIKKPRPARGGGKDPRAEARPRGPTDGYYSKSPTPKAKRPPPGSTPGWQDRLHEMLVDGVTAAEVAREFDWLEHTARARISTALRERGIQVERVRVERNGEKVSLYRALPQLQLGEKREALGNVYRKEESV